MGNFLSQNEAILSALAALLAILLFFGTPLRFVGVRLFRALRARLSDENRWAELGTRKEYMERMAKLLEGNRGAYRAIIVGPLFLHPRWVLDRRNATSATVSYDDKLYSFIMAKSHARNHDIRLILRNSPRYRAKVDKLVLEAERPQFIADMLQAIDLMWGKAGDKGPDLVCADVGHFRIDVIFDHALVSAERLSPDRPVKGGHLTFNKRAQERETRRFDQVFDELSSGNPSEVDKLRTFVRTLWD